MEEESIHCTVTEKIYSNPQNCYSVLRCYDNEGNDLKITGILPNVIKGSELDVLGAWQNHPKYGIHFKVKSFKETYPKTVRGIENYLASGLIKGIGPSLAHAIVSKFGEQTIDIIDNEPAKLIQVSGIGSKKLEKIVESWDSQNEIRNITLFLESHDVKAEYALKIYKQYKEKSLEVLKENPYQISNDIWGIGFQTADEIALHLGIKPDAYQRLQSGLFCVLNRLAECGHCYVTKETLIKEASYILAGKDKKYSISREVIADAIDKMIKDEDVKAEQIPVTGDEKPQMAIYLPQYYYAELGAAIRLKMINKAPRKEFRNEDALAVQQSTIEYEKEQIEAIETAINSKILVLTGGPGTGKTTTTLGIISAFKAAGAEVLLAAPTGRAAKRMREVTSMEAKTIHMLLEYTKESGFKRNKDYPLVGDALIIDESSMIDITLLNSLLAAVPDSMVVIFVGDVDQLPSVGAGNVLRDIIDSDAFQVVRLTKIFRQAETSKIVTNAHKINQGIMPDIDNLIDSDFFFGRCEDSDMVSKKIADLVKNRIPNHFKIPSEDIQVLAPMKSGPAGTLNLNKILQEALNPGGEGITKNGYTFKANDKIMAIKNNYEKGVFNGDVGIIQKVDLEEKEIYALFDTNLVIYEDGEFDQIILAYAATIHKSQGSEYPVVVMPVVSDHYYMLQRNLIYTAVTRAKKLIVMIGSREMLRMGVRNAKVCQRNTLLAARIKNKVSGEEA